MKLIEGKNYRTPQGNMRYMGVTIWGAFPCEICGKMRRKAHEFCANWQDYKNGYVGEWYHYGSECIKQINIVEL